MAFREACIGPIRTITSMGSDRAFCWMTRRTSSFSPNSHTARIPQEPWARWPNSKTDDTPEDVDNPHPPTTTLILACGMPPLLPMLAV